MSTTVRVAISEQYDSDTDVAMVALQYPIVSLEEGLSNAQMEALIQSLKPETDLIDEPPYGRYTLSLTFYVNGLPLGSQTWFLDLREDNVSRSVPLGPGRRLTLGHIYKSELKVIQL